MKKQTKTYPVSPGSPLRLGGYRSHGGVNFSLSVRRDERVEVLLYEPGGKEPFQVIPMDENCKTGLVDAVHVGIPREDVVEYNFRIDGTVVPDPCARVVHTVREKDGSEQIRCGVDPEFRNETEPLGLRYRDNVFYKLHVRGFTAESNVKHPGTFLGVKERIPYLKKMGINAVILMPVYEFYEEPLRAQNGPDFLADGMSGRKNYWGYTDGLYYIPKRRYCATDDPLAEFGDLVKALHENGIECITEFYFDASTPGWRAVDILQYWRMAFQLDGFRLLGFGDWIHSVTNNPILSWSKIFYTHYDPDRIYTDGRPLIHNLAQVNQGFQSAARHFLKGDPDAAGEMRAQLSRQSDQVMQVNFFADHDGMTMYDTVAYNERHNEENGEQNRDGAADNISWNCGVEGETRGRKVNQLRAKQMRNAFLMLMTAQGSPMIYAGDEVCNSQGGNNNAWCQDNEIGHINWNKKKAARDLQKFVADAVAFRKAHPILRMHAPMRMVDYRSVGYPDLSYHGSSAWNIDDGRMKSAFAAMYCGHYAKGPDEQPDDFIYIAYNMYWEEQDFALPDLPEGLRWKVEADTSYADSFARGRENVLLGTSKEKRVVVPERSIMILVSVKDPRAARTKQIGKKRK